jgi:hypothetical protein
MNFFAFCLLTSRSSKLDSKLIGFIKGSTSKTNMVGSCVSVHHFSLSCNSDSDYSVFSAPFTYQIFGVVWERAKKVMNDDEASSSSGHRHRSSPPPPSCLGCNLPLPPHLANFVGPQVVAEEAGINKRRQHDRNRAYSSIGECQRWWVQADPILHNDASLLSGWHLDRGRCWPRRRRLREGAGCGDALPAGGSQCGTIYAAHSSRGSTRCASQQWRSRTSSLERTTTTSP